MDLRFGAGIEGTRVMGGAEATAAIRSSMSTPPKVLVVTNYDTDADIHRRAVGYLLKDAPPHELLAAVHRPRMVTLRFRRLWRTVS